MKQKDIVLIIVVIFFAAVASFIASKFLLGGGDIGKQEVPKVDAMTTTFNPPSKQYFNEDSLDPAPSVDVSDNNNANPFGN